jgi:hypothetical protein
VSEDGLRLSEAQRRSVGSHVVTLESLLRRLRDLGLETPVIDEFLAELADVAQEADAVRPRPGPELRGLAAEVFVVAGEFTPRSFKAYGEVNARRAAWFERRGRRLQGLAERLLDELARSGA